MLLRVFTFIPSNKQCHLKVDSSCVVYSTSTTNISRLLLFCCGMVRTYFNPYASTTLTSWKQICCTDDTYSSPMSHNAPFCNRNALLQNGTWWDICPMHCGICETVLLAHCYDCPSASEATDIIQVNCSQSGIFKERNILQWPNNAKNCVYILRCIL